MRLHCNRRWHVCVVFPGKRRIVHTTESFGPNGFLGAIPDWPVGQCTGTVLSTIAVPIHHRVPGFVLLPLEHRVQFADGLRRQKRT